MIQVLFFTFIILVAFHFIFEGIIAPNLRFEVRTKLFSLRDKLRMLKLAHPNELSDEVYFLLQENINKQLRNMSHINIVNVIQALRTVDHSEIEKRTDEIERLLNSSELAKEVREIHESEISLFGFSFIANSGAWSLYLFPLVAVFILGLLGAAKVSKFFTPVSMMPDEAFL